MQRLGALAAMLRRLIVAIAIVITVQSLMVTYSYWAIGTRLESELVTCLAGQP